MGKKRTNKCVSLRYNIYKDIKEEKKLSVNIPIMGAGSLKERV